jgi:hypothetical protein
VGIHKVPLLFTSRCLVAALAVVNLNDACRLRPSSTTPSSNRGLLEVQFIYANRAAPGTAISGPPRWQGGQACAKCWSSAATSCAYFSGFE